VPLAYGQSVTDECLGWSDTVELIRLLARAVRTQRRTALFRSALASRTFPEPKGGSLERTH